MSERGKRVFRFLLDPERDADVIRRIEARPSMTGYVRELVRRDGHEHDMRDELRDFAALKASELQAENEKLREELVFERCENGWAREFLNRMGPKCGTKDCSSLVAYVTKLESDNAKLREQVAKLREQVGEACMQLGGAWVRCTELMELARFIMHQCNDGNPRCNECIDWNDGECVALQRIRELGIEVDG